MGSLMSGWDAAVHDPKDVKFKRNKSLTKEEIEAYWKSKKKAGEEHIKDISTSVPQLPEKVLKNSATFPIRAEGFDTYKDELINKNSCWWTRSNWAFLNEPPVIGGEGPKFNYAAQHHVAAGFDSSKPHTRITT